MLKIFGRGNPVQEPEVFAFREQVVSRVSKLSSPDIAAYAETSLSECGRLLSKFQRASDTDVKDAYLEEAELNSEVFHYLLLELNRRRKI